MTHFPLILAIDTSCDDTSVAVTCGTVVLSNVVASQTQLHKQYGGVFPTVAKQAHKENLPPTITAALKRARVSWSEVEVIAVTQGPGLAPALEVGLEYAQNLAVEKNLPLIPVNHIEGHVLSSLAQPLPAGASAAKSDELTKKLLSTIKFPILAVVVSGGHTEFVKLNAFGSYERLGFTIDDAAGEALDKFGRMVNLGYPAGPVIEQFAKLGDLRKFAFPLPMKTSGNFNLSFSGMKTSARNLTEELMAQAPLAPQQVYDLCASFQYSVFRAITYKLGKVLSTQRFTEIWLGGGVASNLALRQALRRTIQIHNLKLKVPYTKRLCIDNAAMIGVVAGLNQKNLIVNIANISAVERVPRLSFEK